MHIYYRSTKKLKGGKKMKNLKTIYQEVVNENGLTMRNSQLRFAEKITSVFDNAPRIGIYEVHTGAGKTLAFLLASAYNKSGVVLSTYTKQLQKQTVSEFNSMLRKFFPDVGISILKGKANYISGEKIKRIIEYEKDKPELIKHLELVLQYANIEEVCGDIEILNEILPDETKQVLKNNNFLLDDFIPVDDDECDFYKKAKEKAQQSQIIVTNHFSLFTHHLYRKFNIFADKHLILDEAHTLPEVVESLRQKKIAYSTVKRNISYLHKELANTDIAKKLDFRATEKKLQEIINEISTMAKEDSRKNIILKQTTIASDALQKVIFDSIVKIINEIQPIVKKVDNFLKRNKLIKNYKKIKIILEEIKYSYDIFQNAYNLLTNPDKAQVSLLTNEDEYTQNYFYLVTFSTHWKLPSLAIAVVPPVSVPISRLCSNYITDYNKSIIFTSGTLSNFVSNGNKPDFYEFKKMCFTYNKREFFEKFIVEDILKGIDFRNKIKVYLYSSGPLFKIEEEEIEEQIDDVETVYKATETYVKELKNKVTDIISRAEKNVLILVPSHLEAQIWINELSTYNSAQVFACLPDEVEGSINNFKNADNKKKVLVLPLGRWIGVDIPDIVSDLIITRIPHQNPDDPFLVVAKLRAKNNGKGAQTDLYFLLLRESLVRMRQGMGRLCRNENSKGNIHILDRRIIEQNKYAVFLQKIKKEFTVKIV